MAKEDRDRLVELIMRMGAVASDVHYPRVTPDALEGNLRQLRDHVTKWLEDVEKRPR